MEGCTTYIRRNTDGSADIQNFEVLSWGGVKVVDYKTLRGFISMLKRQNAVCKKRGIKAKFEITLPIKE